MLCDICHENEATIHITEIINDAAKELHVCQQCAEEESIKMQQNFGIADLLSGLMEFPGLIEKDQNLKCPSCGMTYNDFRKLGRLGCSVCYDAFKKVLLPLIKNIHGSTHHVGKEAPRVVTAEKQVKKMKVVSKKDRITELKERLQRAVQNEEYEEAAVLRDRIKTLEKESKDAD